MKNKLKLNMSTLFKETLSCKIVELLLETIMSSIFIKSLVSKSLIVFNLFSLTTFHTFKSF